MGQKINPISLRLQKTNRKYDSSWYSNYHYGELFLFDLKVRDYLERILKQLKYPEGRALISHFSKGSKINLFAFNPTSSRQQKLGAFGLKGGVRISKPWQPKVGHVKQEGQRKLSPVLAKNFQHRNELKRPLKALSSKSKALSIDTEFLLVNQVPTNTFKQDTNKTGNKWNPFLPYLALSCYACEARSASQFRNKFSTFDERTHGDSLGAKQDALLVPTCAPSVALDKVRLNDLGRETFFSVNDSLFLKPYLSGLAYCFANWSEGLPSSVPKQQAHNTGHPSYRCTTGMHKQVFNKSNNKFARMVMQSKKSKVVACCSASGTKCVSCDWHSNGSHLVPFFALKDTLNPSYLLKTKRLRDSCFALHMQQENCASLTQCFATEGSVASHTRTHKQQVVSKTLSLWYQRAQGSTHPILVSLGADKKTIPFLTKETTFATEESKAVAKSNPYVTVRRVTNKQSKTSERRAENRLLVPLATSCFPLSTSFKQKQQSFSCHRHENSLYRCHVEGVLDQQTGSSVKLVPFQVSTEKQSALFLAQEVVYFLEKRVSFRKIKDQILKELKNSKIIKGVRITCSGRVGGKSKKAQKAKTETVKQGQTSLGVFSSKIDFAQKSALTSFGLIGVKVWICFY